MAKITRNNYNSYSHNRKSIKQKRKLKRQKYPKKIKPKKFMKKQTKEDFFMKNFYPLSKNERKKRRKNLMTRNSHLPKSIAFIKAMNDTKSKKLLFTSKILRLQPLTTTKTKNRSKMNINIMPMKIIDNSKNKSIVEQNKRMILAQSHKENDYRPSSIPYKIISSNSMKIAFNENTSETKSETQMKSKIIGRLSNLANDCIPGTTVALPQRTNGRWWKHPPMMHGSKYIDFNPKCKTFQESLYFKHEKQAMKRVENRLREEIAAEKRLAKEKRDQRLALREQNMLRGMVVKPIRNIYKLKKFSKKQWRSVMKASVELKNHKCKVRTGFITC